jgi:hypothetical protein
MVTHALRPCAIQWSNRAVKSAVVTAGSDLGAGTFFHAGPNATSDHVNSGEGGVGGGGSEKKLINWHPASPTGTPSTR